ncbi:AraC family transcriptional regulator [Pseudoalteromonas maricaloris]|uniref:AraC family transcriptional regulator n=1 Tax=Pseudoalteromonas maricaloris TaxID=184924 RepID=UPI000299DDEA|nr:AraC family transcriptional regulator [Pseudoalteromonas flavipulchra]
MHSTSFVYFYSAWVYLHDHFTDDKRLQGEFAELVASRPERVTLVEYERLLEVGRELSGDPLIGFELGKAIQLHDYGALGYLVETSKDLQQAITSLLHYDAIVADIGLAVFTSDSDNAKLTWQPKTPLGKQAILRNMTAWVSAARQLLRSTLSPNQLQLSFSVCDLELQRLQSWFGCPVSQNCPENALSFPLDFLTMPVATVDSLMHEHIEQAVAKSVSALCDNHDLKTRVANLLAAKHSLTGVNQASMAKALNMSVRSMQRKLKAQHTSFRTLLDQERKHRFEQLIDNTRLLDIVDALGFTEQSALNKVCIKWYGKPPSKLK